MYLSLTVLILGTILLGSGNETLSIVVVNFMHSTVKLIKP